MAPLKCKQLVIIFGILILVTLVISSFFIYGKIVSISNEVQTKLDNTNELLTKLNQNIQGLDQLNSNITKIKSDISTIKDTMATLPTNTSIVNVNTKLTQISKNLENLTKVYPPNQTIFLNNVNEDNLNTIINNAVSVEFSKIKLKTNFNFYLNIIFGALLSLGGISFTIIYYVVKKKTGKE